VYVLRKQKKKYIKILNYIFLSLFALACIIPVCWLLYTSIKPRMITFAMPPVWIKFKPTLENYRRIIQDRNLFRPLFNSIIAVSSSTVIAIFIGSLAAYIFSRIKRGWIKPTLFTILITNMIPPAAIILPLFLFARKLDVYDTRMILIAVYIGFSMAFVIWMLRSFFLEIPVAIEECALIDGCSRLGVLFRIVLPLSTPAIAATAILVFIFLWNEFIFALSLTSGHAYTLPLLATGLISAKGVMWGQMAATSTFIAIPEVVFILFAQKHIVRGLTMGAVKG
jgi:multiple sugar transport system permease protein